MHVGDLILSFTAPVILLGLVSVLVRRSHHREFPVFFTYILYVLIADVLRTSVSARPVPRYWLYWTTEAIYGITEVLVIREVFHRVFPMPHSKHRFIRRLVPATVVVILGLTLWQTIYHPVRHHIPWEVNLIYWFDFGVHALEGLLLILLVILAFVFPISWKQYEFGIVTGFGVAAGITVVAYLMRFVWGMPYELFFRYGPPLGYIAATLIWLHAFLQPRKTPRTQTPEDDLLAQLRHSRRFARRIGRWFGPKLFATPSLFRENPAKLGERGISIN
jgi:hypothetical protein